MSVAKAIRAKKMADGGEVEGDKKKTLGSIIGYPGFADGGEVDPEAAKPAQKPADYSGVQKAMGDHSVIDAFNRFHFAAGGAVAKAIRAKAYAAGGEVEEPESQEEDGEEEFVADESPEDKRKGRLSRIFSGR